MSPPPQPSPPPTLILRSLLLQHIMHIAVRAKVRRYQFYIKKPLAGSPSLQRIHPRTLFAFADSVSTLFMGFFFLDFFNRYSLSQPCNLMREKLRAKKEP